MQGMPLGDYELFEKWSGRPRSWGAGGAARVWFGGQVLDGLCIVLDEHLAATGGGSAGIGCVPWLTSEAVVDRLAKLNSLCVVIDKAQRSRKAIARLMDEEYEEGEYLNGFPNAAISGLAGLVPARNGERVIVGPYTPREVVEHVIDPVRTVGWLKEAKDNPIVHAKMLVLGEISWPIYETPYGTDEGSPRFTPRTVWMGSANWTGGSPYHLEFGIVSQDSELLSAATDFVADVIAFSEPLGSSCAGPEPNMLGYEVDDAAMWEAAENQRIAHEEWEAQQLEDEP
ncbi:hypothetical protein NLX62_02460 [Mycobacteriaceae bacterium Msp059]|nr:hypothetical protein [Mycobacteriaceae bacterium Msp059]